MRLVLRRGVVLAWWLAQAFCGLCCLAAIVVLIYTRLSTDGQICAAALLLAGAIALAGGRLLLRLGSRGSRRRIEVY